MKNYLKNQKVRERVHKGKSLVKTIAALALPVLCVTCLVKGIDNYLSEPVSYAYINIDGKGEKDDLIVKTRRGETFEFIHMPDGKYKLLAKGEKEAIEEEARMQFYLDNNIPFSSRDL